MSDAALLAHDVGKYVARIARNVKPGAPVPAALIPMLVRDLYELPSGQKGKLQRASERFEDLAGALAPDVRLDRARTLLSEIDSLEASVRAKDGAACAAACALALEVEALLREVAST